MTRGRKKDLTIPPSRALTQQRDYRARKAAYISNLEERCRKSEEENVRLRKELELARAGLPVSSVYSSEVSQASSELKQQLSTAFDTLTRLQKLAFPESGTPGSPTAALRPASFPSPAPSPPFYHSTSSRSSNQRSTPSQSTSITSGSSEVPPARIGEPPFSRISPSPSPSLGSECCGGFMDCRDLIEQEEEEEEEEEVMEEDELDERWMKTSGMRSTSDNRERSRTSQHIRRPPSHDP